MACRKAGVRRRLAPSEHEEQASLISWADSDVAPPEARFIFAIPNGAKLPYIKTRTGKRFSREALKLLQEGLRPGVPDLFLPVPRGDFAGLFIELKSQTGTATPQQLVWLSRLTAQGYRAVLCRGWEAARDEIIGYLGKKEDK